MSQFDDDINEAIDDGEHVLSVVIEGLFQFSDLALWLEALLLADGDDDSAEDAFDVRQKVDEAIQLLASALVTEADYVNLLDIFNGEPED